MIAALLLSAVQPSLVTVITPTADVPTVLSSVTKETGVLHTGPGFEREFLTLHVTDVDPAELREKIAFALDSSWTPSGNGFRLTRSAADLTRLRSDDLDRMVESLEEDLDRVPRQRPRLDLELMQGYLASAKEWDEYYEDDEDFTPPPEFKYEPSTVAMCEVFRAIGLRQLIDIPIGKRTVFSTHPTAAQRAIPRSAMQIMARGAAEEAYLKDNSEEFFGGLEANRPFAVIAYRTSDQVFYFEWNKYTPVPETTPRSPFANYAQIQYLDDYSFHAGDEREFAESLTHDRGERIEFAGLDKLFHQTVLGLDDSDYLRSVSSEVFPDVVRREPYTFVWDASIAAIAGAMDLDLVIVPENQLWNVLTWTCLTQAHPNTGMIADLLGLVNKDRGAGSHWKVIKPKLSIASRMSEPDRSDLQDFMRDSLASNGESLWPLIRFLAKSKLPSAEFTGMSVLQILQPFGNALEDASDFESTDSLQFIGSLSSESFRTLTEQGNVLIERLPQVTQKKAWDWVQSHDLLTSYGTSYRERLYFDPSVLYPRSLPAGTQLNLNVEKNLAFYVQFESSNGSRQWMTLGAEEGAHYFYYPSNGSRVVGIAPNTLVYSTYRIVMPDGLEVSEFLTSVEFPYGRNGRSIEDMPSEYREILEKARLNPPTREESGGGDGSEDPRSRQGPRG
ncbi:MAG: hypothetical protein KF812_07985 [Fimbriimonadaceae bacterium]|nr:hypothetical protein [Fimbriimonadaceae bacterium]